MTSNQAPVEPGGIVRVLCDTTDDQRVTADITAETVDLLKCGCWRIRTTRPGPDMGEYTCRSMEVIFRTCRGPHDDGSQVDGTAVPAPIVIQRTAVTALPPFADGDRDVCHCLPGANPHRYHGAPRAGIDY
jgi:hypothetical protein